MPSIKITETDRTLYGLNEATSDNIVYVPGPAITGPANEPTLLNSYDELVSTFGDKGCEDSLSWDYAANLLLARMPVLYHRIAEEVDSIPEEPVANTPYAVYSKYTDDTQKFTARAENAGTGGDRISFSLYSPNEANYVWLKVWKDGVLQESFRVASTGENEAATGAAVAEALNTDLVTSLKNIRFNIASDWSFVAIGDSKSGVSLTGGSDPTRDSIIATLGNAEFSSSPFAMLSDKYIYDVKFITSGGYTDSEASEGNSGTPIALNMLKLANAREDCTAFPDIPDSMVEDDRILAFFNGLTGVDASYGAAYAPWFEMKLADRSYKMMPPSYIFLITLARSLQNNPIWMPPAGVDRATLVNAVKPTFEIGGPTLQKWQDNDGETLQCINPIMKLRQYGYVIYGQRTLMLLDDSNRQSSLKSLNVRITSNEIKKAIFTACIGLTFEQNTLRTWNEFKSRVEPKLLEMKSGRGINDYEIIMDDTTTSAVDMQENRIRGIVRVSILNAVEHFDIGFEIMPSSVTFGTEETTEVL